MQQPLQPHKVNKCMQHLQSLQYQPQVHNEVVYEALQCIYRNAEIYRLKHIDPTTNQHQLATNAAIEQSTGS
jgi:hypothetical protein